MARRLEAGSVLINEYSGTDVELPFGGYKNSGYGKEKGVDALSHYQQVKTVRIRLV
jgi:aldehyde dehydrogenase (NAD+)